MKVTLLFIVISYCCSCNEIRKGKGATETQTKYDASSKSFDHSSYQLVRQAERMSQIEAIDTTKDKVQIRVWCGCTNNDTVLVVSIIEKDTGWEGSLDTLFSTWDKNFDSIVRIDKSSVVKIPKTRWKPFVGKLKTLGIFGLPNSSDLPNYSLGTDENAIRVETFDGSNHRFYSYSDPARRTNIPEAQQMEKILKLLEYEFGFKRLC
jgi:hypothetical protein